MSKNGLLNKATTFNDRSSGITTEDRRDILAKIEELTKKNRISGERTPFTALRRGLLFPIVVNLAAIALTAGGLWGLSVTFREKEAAASRVGASLSSAEGKLIRELKRDSESKLTEKDKEIADMQSRIANLDADRTKLQSSFESRIATKETELRAELKVELEKERQRLQAAGLTETAIQERLKRFEEERTAAFRRDIAEFQKKIDAEKAAADANFAKLREEYALNMTKVNDERKRILDDSRKREDELRSSMDVKTKALEKETAQATAEREKARAELSRAEETRKTEQASEERIVGLYLTVRTAIQERRFEEAATRAAALKAYLTDPTVASVASAQRRRQADSFAAEALAFMARTELERASLDTSLLLRQAELVSAVRGATQNARTALKSGNIGAGDIAYNDALKTIPEILEAHEYFTKRAQETEARRRDKAAKASADATAAMDRGDYEAASLSYRDAATQLFVDEASAKALAEGIARLSVADYSRSRSAADTKAAQAPLAKAFNDLQSEKWAAALTAFSGILSQYPSARQTPETLKGIEEAFAGLFKSAENKANEDRKRIAELENEALRLAAELRDEKAASAAELARVGTQNDEKIAELQRLLDTARKESENASIAARTAEEEKSRLAKEAAASNGDPVAQLAKLREENAKLAAAAARYDSLVSSYASYRLAEDATRAKGGQGSLVEARLRFDAFLDDGETRRAFPDLRERLTHYLQDYIAANQAGNLNDAMSVAENALGLRDVVARNRYFDDLSRRYAEDPNMSAYVETLRRGLR
ncbi:MAG: hypothetical protein WCT14_09110 [Treponemataceae bacterium]